MGPQSKAGRLSEKKHPMPPLAFEVLLPGSPARTISYYKKAKIRFDMDKYWFLLATDINDRSVVLLVGVVTICYETLCRFGAPTDPEDEGVVPSSSGSVGATKRRSIFIQRYSVISQKT